MVPCIGCSFLPHEVSDVGDEIRYDDFSMWDIYRAELPLYTLITPKRSGEMMQSLVRMYQNRGWLPAFPCWNSYTAAMIGDHASAALADAYVKESATSMCGRLTRNAHECFLYTLYI